MRSKFASAVLAALLLAGCMAGRRSSAGFHLPDGSVEHGRTAFVEFRCYSCHQVEGVSLPAPVAEPAVPVILGGVVAEPPTDGALAAAIIDPSHRLSPEYPAHLVRSGSRSRMGDFGESMTVRQLVDLVAFLQSTYVVQAPEMVGGP